MSADFAIISSDGLRFYTNKQLLQEKSMFFKMMFDDTPDYAIEHTSTFISETVSRLCDIIKSQYDFARRGTISEQIDLLNALDFYDMKEELDKHIKWASDELGKNASYVEFLIRIRHRFVAKFVDHPDKRLRSAVLDVLPKIKWQDDDRIIAKITRDVFNAEEEVFKALVKLIKAEVYPDVEAIAYTRNYAYYHMTDKKWLWDKMANMMPIPKNISKFVEEIKKIDTFLSNSWLWRVISPIVH